MTRAPLSDPGAGSAAAPRPAGRVEIAEATSPEDLAAIRALCRAFRSWLMVRYVDHPDIIEAYYAEDRWEALLDDLPRLAPNSHAYRFEYNDGLKVTIIQFLAGPGQKGGGVVGDCNLAARLKGGEIFSVLFYLPYYSMRNFFNPQVHHIETLFLTGKSPYPIERTLLTTGMTAAGIESLYQKQRRLETPHLAISYEATRESTFWRT